MSIVLITEALMRRSTLKDGSLLRDLMLSGFCVRMNARKRTFRIATSEAGKQFRMNLGYWPLMSVDEARAQAMQVLAQCRRGERPARPAVLVAPTLRELYLDYAGSRVSRLQARLAMNRSIAPTSRIGLIARCRIGRWWSSKSTAMHLPRPRGPALVELGRGVVGSLVKYVNALHGLTL